MQKLKSLDEIKSITVHWSESSLINDELGCNDDGDIEKIVDPVVFDRLIKRAAKEVGIGYDKISLTLTAADGHEWCKECKFYLTAKKTSLLDLIS